MARYFMSDTPLAWLEREMMTQPGFGSRRVRSERQHLERQRCSSGVQLKKGTILVWRAEYASDSK
jgi:hypothetical protein